MPVRRPGADEKIVFLVERAERSRYFEAALPLLRSAGFDPLPVTLRPPGELHDALRGIGFETRSLEAAHSGHYPRAAARLAGIVRTDQPSLIHAHEAIPGVIAGAGLRLVRRRPPVLLHRHHAQVTGIQRLLSRLASRLCDRTIGVSQNVVSAASRYDGVPERKICLAWNGIPDLRHVSGAETAALRDRLGIPAAGLVIVVVARLRREKGVYSLLDGISRLEEGNSHLVVVGDGPEAKALSAAVVELRLDDRVHAVGHQSDVALWYSLADVVAVPSLSEPFGLVAIEAAAASKAVLASDVGGLREIVVDGTTGLLVRPGDPDAIAAAIVRLMRDEDERHTLGVAARDRYMESFTVETMVARWIECYEAARRAPRSAGDR